MQMPPPILGNPYNQGGPPGLNKIGLNKGLHLNHKSPIIEEETKEPKEDSEEESKGNNNQPKVSALNILPLLYIKNIANDEVLERWAIRF